MNGAHDLGGMHGLGPIRPEPEAEEPVFHADWEKTAFAMTLACGALGRWNLDISRHARERQHPVVYLRQSYYENWMAGLETLLVEAGLVTPEELAAGRPRASAPAELNKRVLTAERVAGAMAKGGPVDMEVADAPAFGPGDPVRVRNFHPTGHTRAPRYVRGRLGTVDAHHGAHVFADRHAEGERVGRHLYSVRFEARELWGPQGEDRGAVYVDLWQDYLEPA